MKNSLTGFLLCTVLLSVSCGSSNETNEYSATEIKMPRSSKSSVKNKDEVLSEKAEYPKVDLPDGNENNIDAASPETIARKKKSYVYYKPVSIKPTEKPSEKAAVHSDKPVETYRSPDVPDVESAKKQPPKKKLPDLSKKLVKQ